VRRRFSHKASTARGEHRTFPPFVHFEFFVSEVGARRRRQASPQAARRQPGAGVTALLLHWAGRQACLSAAAPPGKATHWVPFTPLHLLFIYATMNVA
jgi:hypothetical protein